MNKKMAVIVSGWYFPMLYYNQLSAQRIPEGWEVDYFCVSHRPPEYAEKEMKPIVDKLNLEPLTSLDKLLYEEFATVEKLEKIGWNYSLEPNTIGDWAVTNQWLEKHPNYKDYEILLITHDDNWLLGDDLFYAVLGGRIDTLIRNNISIVGHEKAAGNESSQVPYDDDWLVISNGLVNFTAKARGSFDFFKTSLIEDMGGSFDLSRITETREGKYDSGEDVYTSTKDWEKTVQNFHNFMYQNELVDKIRYLSSAYRVSYWCIEGERGLISNKNTPQQHIYVDALLELAKIGRLGGKYEDGNTENV